MRAAVRAGSEGKRKSQHEKTKSASAAENKPKVKANRNKNNGYINFMHDMDQKRMASESILKLIKAGKDPSKVLRAISLNKG